MWNSSKWDISYFSNIYVDVYGHLIKPAHSTYQKKKKKNKACPFDIMSFKLSINNDCRPCYYIDKRRLWKLINIYAACDCQTMGKACQMINSRLNERNGFAPFLLLSLAQASCK